MECMMEIRFLSLDRKIPISHLVAQTIELASSPT